MKRLAVLVAGLLALPVAASATVAPSTSIAVAQEVQADWMRLNGASGNWYIATATRFPSDAGIETFGGVGKGMCFVDRSFVTCIAMIRIKRLPLDAFTMDPAMTTAELKVSQQGREHQVTWTGEGEAPNASSETGSGPKGAHVALISSRDATASGTIFGRKVTTRKHDLAEMFEGAIVGLNLKGIRVEEISPDYYRLTKTFRLTP
jgi:hypothetical protein